MGSPDSRLRLLVGRAEPLHQLARRVLEQPAEPIQIGGRLEQLVLQFGDLAECERLNLR
jgi:hypothetical protein